MKKKTIALLLCLCLAFTILPGGVFAAPAAGSNPGLNFRQLLWEEASGSWRVDDSAYFAGWGPGLGKVHQVQFVYLSGTNNETVTVLERDDLTFPAGLGVDYVRDDGGKVVDPSYLELTFGNTGVFVVEYPSGTGSLNTVDFRVSLPGFGFYSGPVADAESWLGESWNYDGTNQTVYFVPGDSGEVLTDVSNESDDAEIVLAPDGSYAKITLREPRSELFSLHFASTGFPGGRSWGIRLNDLRPGLVWRWVRRNGQTYEENTDMEPNGGTNAFAPGNFGFLAIYYDDRSGKAPVRLRYEDLSFSGGFFTAEPLENGEFVSLYFSDFGEGRITYAAENVSMRVLSDQPEVAYYSRLPATKENYLKAWDYDGTNKEVYLAVRDSMKDRITLSDFADESSSGAVIVPSTDGTYAAVTLNDLTGSWLSISFTEKDSHSSWRNASGIGVNDRRPGLVWRWAYYEDGKLYTSPTSDYSRQLTITAGSGRVEEIAFFDGTACTPLTAEELTVEDRDLLAVENADDQAGRPGDHFVRLADSGIGTTEISYSRGGVKYALPVSIILPDLAYYSDQNPGGETLLRSWDYTGENKTIYLIARNGRTLTDVREWTESYGDGGDNGAVIDRISDTCWSVTVADPKYSCLGLWFSGTFANGNPMSDGYSIRLNDLRPKLQVREMFGPSDVYSFTSKYDAMSRAPGAEVLIRPWIPNGGQDYVFTGTLASQNPELVSVSLYDAEEHIWKVSFLGSGNTWLTGQEGSTAYCIGIRGPGPDENAPGETMFFEIAFPPHSGYLSDGLLWSGFGMPAGSSRVFQFLMGDQAVSSGFRYDSTALTMEELDGDNGIYRITGRRPGRFSIGAGSSACDVFVYSAFLDLQEVPAKEPTETEEGNIAYFLDPEGNAYVIPDYPFAADEVMTRAKLALFTATAFGWSEADAADPYTDLDPDSPEYNAILTLTGYGIMTDLGDGSFGPDDMVPRAQAANIFARCLNVLDQNWDGVRLPADVPENAWYSASVRACLAYDLLTVDENGLFSPNSALTFGDIRPAAFLRHTGVEQIAPENTVLPALLPLPDLVVPVPEMDRDQWSRNPETGMMEPHGNASELDLAAQFGLAGSWSWTLSDEEGTGASLSGEGILTVAPSCAAGDLKVLAENGTEQLLLRIRLSRMPLYAWGARINASKSRAVIPQAGEKPIQILYTAAVFDQYGGELDPEGRVVSWQICDQDDESTGYVSELDGISIRDGVLTILPGAAARNLHIYIRLDSGNGAGNYLSVQAPLPVENEAAQGTMIPTPEAEVSAIYSVSGTETEGYRAAVTLLNTASSAVTANVFLAQYDSEGRMTGLRMETVEIPAGDAGTATLEASGEDGDRLSLMVLDEAFAAVTENVEVNLES